MSLTDQIQNYVETMVEEKIYEKLGRDVDLDTMVDIACVALNQLSPRYIRYAVDFVFYLSPEERTQLFDDVENAVKEAIEYVKSHKRIV
ncbi:late competence development ComFB family protein [Litoribacillus peritrichatus]|uniref:Competence protein ComFB n=1 Tax=Litoribacillus peritrichatus TaxID=718191 RepID=A0ABP7MHH1_9GAMM